MNPIEEFQKEKEENILLQGSNAHLKQTATAFMNASIESRYSYNFTWLGRPIIQYPQDMIAMQEILWDLKPDLVIETGIAHGGSLIFYASILEMIGKGEVLGIDIDIRKHNRAEIEAHPMFKRIKMIQGSSIDPAVLSEVERHTTGKESVLVLLDSNHTHDHVLSELQMYSPFVTLNSYLVVYDTIVEKLADDSQNINARPWGPGNNPWTALNKFLEDNPQFEIDQSLNNKLLITVAPDGYLKRTK